MNFFGHASVACWLHDDPRWVLGAMLPDFASMSGARLRHATDPTLAAGIAFHHVTDEVFHAAGTFLDLCEGGADALEARGLGRGPARAVAHVGIELLLDGLLLDDADSARAYLGALASAGSEELSAELSTRSTSGFTSGSERLASLLGRLESHGLPEDYRSAQRVAVRVRQTLARRPRLAITEGEEAIVLPWLERTRRELERRAPALLREVREGLAGEAVRAPRGARSSDRGAVDTAQAGHGILRGHRA